MSAVNLLTQVDESMVAKLPTVTIKLANGQDMLVVDGKLSGDILASLLTWNSFNKVHSNHNEDGMAVGGHDVDKDISEWQELFIGLVLVKGIASLVELSEASVRLELWSLFELCSKTLADEIIDLSIFSFSAPFIEGLGVLKCLSLEKRHELDTIESKGWQQASYGLWSEQKVLRFGSGQLDMDNCKHSVLGFDKTNLVECTKDELDQNRKSIEHNDERKCPERFLDIVRKCSNLVMISWDSNFGEMADPEFAYVLKMSCPQLEHVQGLVRRKFKVNQEQICPASFISVFKRDKNISCYNVKYIETIEAEQMLSKIAEDAKNDELAKIKKQKEDEEIILENEAKELALKSHLRVNVTKYDALEKVHIDQMLYIVSYAWYKTFEDYVLLDSVKPGRVDNSDLCKSDSFLKPHLKMNVHYVALSKTSWDIIEANFGADHAISRPVIVDSHGLSLGLAQVICEFPAFRHTGYYGPHTSFFDILQDAFTHNINWVDEYCLDTIQQGSTLVEAGIRDGETIVWHHRD